jgi:hypothetical protein
VVVLYEMMMVRFNEGDHVGVFCYLRRPLAGLQSGVIKVVDLNEDHERSLTATYFNGRIVVKNPADQFGCPF